jgi:nucleoside-diphosphate-sugar epimerase
LFINSNIQKFIQIGSSVEYGKIKSPQSEKKLSKKKIHSFYGASKLLSSIYLMNLYRKHNFPVIILRPYLVYGPNQDPNRIIPISILNSIFQKEFDCSNGKQYRDFLYIEDLVDGIIKSLKNKNLFGEILNIGQGKPIKLRRLISKISQMIGTGKPKFGKIKLRKDEIIKLYPKISKIKKLINWKPKTDLDRGLQKTINYYQKNKFEFSKFIK